MKKEVILVSTTEELIRKIPQLRKQAKGKNLYIDYKLVKEFRKDKSPSIEIGNYNVFLGRKTNWNKYISVILVRESTYPIYMQPKKTEKGIFLKIAQ